MIFSESERSLWVLHPPFPILRGTNEIFPVESHSYFIPKWADSGLFHSQQLESSYLQTPSSTPRTETMKGSWPHSSPSTDMAASHEPYPLDASRDHPLSLAHLNCTSTCVEASYPAPSMLSALSIPSHLPVSSPQASPAHRRPCNQSLPSSCLILCIPLCLDRKGNIFLLPLRCYLFWQVLYWPSISHL